MNNDDNILKAVTCSGCGSVEGRLRKGRMRMSLRGLGVRTVRQSQESGDKLSLISYEVWKEVELRKYAAYLSKAFVKYGGKVNPLKVIHVWTFLCLSEDIW